MLKNQNKKYSCYEALQTQLSALVPQKPLWIAATLELNSLQSFPMVGLTSVPMQQMVQKSLSESQIWYFQRLASQMVPVLPAAGYDAVQPQNRRRAAALRSVWSEWKSSNTFKPITHTAIATPIPQIWRDI